MLFKYIDILAERLKAAIEPYDSRLVKGDFKPDEFPEYKYIAGVRQGHYDALRIANQLYDEMFNQNARRDTDDSSIGSEWL